MGVVFDQNARAISQATGQPINAANAVQVLVAGQQSCGAGNNAYKAPDQITLRYDNSGGGAAVTCKFPSFDNMVEAFQGSIGTVFPTVLQLPNGNGTVAQQAGGNIYGAQSLARLTATMVNRINKVQLSNTQAASLSTYTINTFYGNPKGVDNNQILLNVDKNFSNVTTLSAIVDWPITANCAFSFSVDAAKIADITLYYAGYQPYTDLISKGQNS